MTDLLNAKNKLKVGLFTCVLCKGKSIYTSNDRGIKPLVKWHLGGEDFSSYSAADKVVGKGAAFVYLLMKIKNIYADVISEAALRLFNENGINVEYNMLVPNIINRKGDGICPFEEAVLNIDDKDKALEIILNKMKI